MTVFNLDKESAFTLIEERGDARITSHFNTMEDCAEHMRQNENIECAKRMSMRIKLLETALSRIVKWNELSLEWQVNNGSNGQRDYYRSIADAALNGIDEND